MCMIPAPCYSARLFMQSVLFTAEYTSLLSPTRFGCSGLARVACLATHLSTICKTYQVPVSSDRGGAWRDALPCDGDAQRAAGAADLDRPRRRRLCGHALPARALPRRDRGPRAGALNEASSCISGYDTRIKECA